jgi:hypothetical protein
VAQVLHAAQPLPGGALSDGYLCAWLNSLPPCCCIVIAQVVDWISQPYAIKKLLLLPEVLCRPSFLALLQ